MPKTGRPKSDYVMLALVAVAVFAFWVLIPQAPRGTSPWAEGRAIGGCIASAIVAYAAEHGPDGPLPVDDDFAALGFDPNDLDGHYFNQRKDGMFSFKVTSLEPLKFTVTVTNPALDPPQFTLDQDHKWSEARPATEEE